MAEATAIQKKEEQVTNGSSDSYPIEGGQVTNSRSDSYQMEGGTGDQWQKGQLFNGRRDK